MRTFSYEPTYRDSMPIRIVRDPDALWFDRLGRLSARFSLMSDGQIYWGDAEMVLHQDIMRFRRPPHRPLLVGVIRKVGEDGWNDAEDGTWTVLLIQFFLAGHTDTKLAKPFLQRLTTWNAVEKRIGPFSWYDWGEDGYE